MENPMSRNTSTCARRTVISSLTALVLAAALPQAGIAQVTTIYPPIGLAGNQMDSGVWKLKNSRAPAGNPQNRVLEMERNAKPVVPENPGRLLIVSRGNVYIATGEAAKDSLAGKRVDPKRMVKIGSNVRSNEPCGTTCQFGETEKHLTLTFTALDGQKKVLAHGGR
jgi:hypothetical protein